MSVSAREQTMPVANLPFVSPQFKDESPSPVLFLIQAEEKSITLYQTRCNNINANEWYHQLNREAIATMPTFRFAIYRCID